MFSFNEAILINAPARHAYAGLPTAAVPVAAMVVFMPSVFSVR
jgi:hypothetical protein